jgi:UDP-glucuronate decarboxylase
MPLRVPSTCGNPGEFTIAELADLVLELTGTSSSSRAAAAARPTTRSADGQTSHLAKKVLGWQPTVQLREGLLRTIEYFQNSDSAFMAPAIAATAPVNS